MTVDPPVNKRVTNKQDGGPEQGSAAPKAVALRHDRDLAGGVPRVVAKGRGPVAEQIIRVAKEHNIFVREDADLVEVLEALEIDSLIPVEAYMAVAEILGYVYRANSELRARKLR